MQHKLALFLFLSLGTLNVLAQEEPKIPSPDRIRLAEAFRIGETLGNEVWEEWSRAPFALLLVTPEHEFLIRHPNPSRDFNSIGYDSLLKSNVYFRKRIYQTNLLATFPAVNGVPTIVVGPAENTGKSSAVWVVTILHEHFHQLQQSQPDYNSAVKALGLAHGDETGMWMLNYPFPYDSSEVKKQFSVLCQSLWEALLSTETKEFANRVSAYLEARRKLKEVLSNEDFKYFSFQVWQEGIARYTEYQIAKLAAEKYEPSNEFKSLPDFTLFKGVADSTLKNILSELPTLPVAGYRRVAFYYIGAGEGLLLDTINPIWKEMYFKKKFSPESYFEEN